MIWIVDIAVHDFEMLKLDNLQFLLLWTSPPLPHYGNHVTESVLLSLLKNVVGFCCLALLPLRLLCPKGLKLNFPGVLHHGLCDLSKKKGRKQLLFQRCSRRPAHPSHLIEVVTSALCWCSGENWPLCILQTSEGWPTPGSKSPKSPPPNWCSYWYSGQKRNECVTGNCPRDECLQNRRVGRSCCIASMPLLWVQNTSCFCAPSL